MVPKAGLEPARPRGQWILSPQRLPFHHFGTAVRLGKPRNRLCDSFQMIIPCDIPLSQHMKSGAHGVMEQNPACRERGMCQR